LISTNSVATFLIVLDIPDGPIPEQSQEKAEIKKAPSCFDSF
jgi:hypothetical protein